MKSKKHMVGLVGLEPNPVILIDSEKDLPHPPVFSAHSSALLTHPP